MGQGVRELSLRDPATANIILEEVLKRGMVFAIQLPTVYALGAAGTNEGVRNLRRSKKRAPRKIWGTGAADFGGLYSVARVEGLCLEDVSEWDELFSDAFIRVPVDCSKFHPEMVCKEGKHQTLHLGNDPDYNAFFSTIQEGLQDAKCPPMPILTSMNWSVKQSSCTTRLSAWEFLNSVKNREKTVPYFVVREQQDNSGETGSYPVFEITESSVILRRKGPGSDAIVRNLWARGITVLHEVSAHLASHELKVG